MRHIINGCLLLTASFLTSISYASPAAGPWYLALNGGIFQGNFNMQYNDLADVIALNIRQPVQQNGYSGGIGVGYIHQFTDRYLFGAELSGKGYSDHADFASGASSTAFSEQITVNGNVDIALIAGLFLNDITAVYAKAGLGMANITSTLLTPAGFSPTYVQSYNSTNSLGAAIGIGAQRWLNPHVSIIAEYLYHDYGNINFSNFQNFATIYTHAAKLTTQNLVVGINYYI